MAAKPKEPKAVLAEISELQLAAKESISHATDQTALEKVKVDYLGRKSPLTNILKSIKALDPEAKKELGKAANDAKIAIVDLISTKAKKLQKEYYATIAQDEKIDVTLPGKTTRLGTIHPITQMLWKTEDIFQRMGFEIHYPYEVDTDFHNFQAVNIPEGHPARDAWDTFWTKDGHIAITHTSSMQNRVLSSHEPPIRAIVPGRCFRHEATDARHEHTFFQVEGIYVDKNISLGDMLGTLQTYFTAFFEKEVQVKFGPDFFPFVEPGGMISLTCILCDGKGCRVCKQSGWLEILGCGMIHPNVLKMAGINPDVYTGFAWGFGLERMVMLKYNVEDVRHFNSGKLSFIKQF